MLLNLNWSHSQRRTRRGGVSPPAILEQRALLAGATPAGITYSIVPAAGVQPIYLLVVGTLLDDEIKVGINGVGNFEIVDQGGTTDTGISATTLGIKEVRIVGGPVLAVLGSGDDVLTLDASLASMKGRLYGGVGSDVLTANNSGRNNLLGGVGNDVLVGGTGNSILSGQEGDDVLYGGSGSESLFGGSGSDILFGNGGNDFLHANELGNFDDFARDRLFGGTGSDTFFGVPGPGPLFDKFFDP